MLYMTKNRVSSRVRTISQAADRWLTDARDRNLSEHTQRNYDRTLSRFAAYLDGAGFPQQLAEIGAPHIRSFVHYLQAGPGVKPSSVRTYLITLATFFAFCRREGWIEESPFTDGRLGLPKIPQEIVPSYTANEVKAFLRACEAGRDRKVRLRDLAIVYILLDTGIRESELCGLTLEDVEFTPRDKGGGYLKVFGKGRKERYVWFSTTTARVLQDYLDRARPDTEDDCLFVAKGGGPITPSGLYELVKRKGEQAGVPDATVHRFRHTFALTFLQKASTAALKRQLGHTTEAQSLKYAGMLPTAGAKEHQEASPVEQMGLSRRRR